MEARFSAGTPETAAEPHTTGGTGRMGAFHHTSNPDRGVHLSSRRPCLRWPALLCMHDPQDIEAVPLDPVEDAVGKP